MFKSLLSLLLLFGMLIQLQANSVVYLKITEAFVATTFASSLVVSSNTGEVETIPLEKVKTKAVGEEGNGVIIAQTIQKYLDQGYEIKSHSIAGTDVLVTSIILVKED
jgi:hypothetical protein